jgi:hypothetical protein
MNSDNLNFQLSTFIPSGWQATAGIRSCLVVSVAVASVASCGGKMGRLIPCLVLGYFFLSPIVHQMFRHMHKVLNIYYL